MSEQEWLKATEPARLRRLLGKAMSPRKLRLFACACVRRIEHLLPDPRSRKALEVSERYADGLIDDRELAEAEAEAGAAIEVAAAFVHGALNDNGRWAEVEGARAARWLVENLGDLAEAMWDAARLAFCAASPAAGSSGRCRAVEKEERRRQCDLLRDIFGNPFRPVSLDRRRLAGSGRTLRRLAESIYEERTFDELPVLGDALEDAGCTDRELIDHCRSGEHVRGCWVVDLVLGKS